MSRPHIPIDWKKVDEFLMAHCFGTEIAAYFGMHEDTFYRRVEEQYGMGFTEYCQLKRGSGKLMLRARQYAKAMTGDNTMLVWLGKNLLDQREPETKAIAIPNDGKINDLLDYIKQKKEKEVESSDNALRETNSIDK